MHVPDISDAAWVARVLAQEGGRRGLPAFTAVRLLDAQIVHPHRPDSPRCKGWATYRLEGAEEALVCLQASRDRDLVVWRFPDDPVLGGLRGLLAAGDDAAGLVGRDGAVGVTAHVVRWQPGRSCTVRFDVPGTPPCAVYGKAVDGVDVRAAAARHEALWLAAQSSALRVAQPLGCAPALKVLWTRGVPGLSFAAAPWHGAAQALGAAAAASIAGLHASAAEPQRRVVVGDCVAEARKKVAKLSTALPSVAPSLGRLLAGTQASLARAAPARELTVHGDLHLDQLIATAQGAVLLDLDELGLGPPELDAAELVVDAVMRDRSEGQTLAASFLAAYEAERGLDRALLRALADAEFVTRCYRHLRRRAPGWEARLATAIAGHARLSDTLR